MNGYLRHPILGLLCAFALYFVVGLLLWNISAGMNNPDKGPMSDSERFTGNILTVALAVFSLGLSGFAMAKK
ncbi:MAG: hypothetical protein V4662_23875 [Verrucomicrobiota bacterium]